jgi:Zn finger protein HypA/HybF involved in hydrogenase expression
MSKSIDEMMKELIDFAEKASTAVKADKLIDCAPPEAIQKAFRAACNVTIALAKGELKPENIPDSAPELALIVMGVGAAKRMGLDPKEVFGRKKEPEKTSGEVGGEAGKPEQSEQSDEKCPVCGGPAHRVTSEGEVHMISGTFDEVMGKLMGMVGK